MRPLLAMVLLSLGCGEESARWEWEVRPPEELGMDGAILDGARAYAFQDGKHTQGVVVVRRGAIVAEWYEDGANADRYAASWSMAKSVTSALVGIAIDEGLIAGVDAPLGDTYAVWQGSPRGDIRVEDVLHMASGLEWIEEYDIASADESDAAKLVLTTESPLDHVLSKPLESAPNTVWEYSSGDTLLLSGVLADATGMTAGDYAQARLFSRLGIEGAQWWQAKTGETLTYCCLDMTSRDFARFGLLYLDGGQWQGEQVVPAAWVEASLLPTPLYEGYGYKWWLDGRVDTALPADLFAARGFDGQYIYVISSRELVVVRNGHYDKFDGPPIADPTLFLRYPQNGVTIGAGTIGPDSWSDAEFLAPILASIVD